jgi:hypothetical protein
MSFELDWLNDDVVIIYKDNVEFEDIAQANDIIYGSPRFDSMKYQILDCRKVENLNVSKENMQVIGTLEKSATTWNNDVKIACVTTKECIREIFREYVKFMQVTNWEFKIFDNYPDAENWCKRSVHSRVTVK